MSLVTRCPACTTTFKVVRDQLRISDGWVRCGRCSNVFDATLDLHETPDSAGSAAAAPGASPAVQGSGFMPGLVEQPASQPAPAPQAPTPPPSQPPAAPPAPETLSSFEADLDESEQPSSSTAEDADFFDDEPEHQRQRKDWLTEDEHLLPADALVLDQAPKTPPSLSAASPAPAPASPLPAFSLSLPEHGIAADEPWSDLDATQPAWKPPAS
uniref:zinc-ribbon domain-containing protein n=1 Tax=uncultured Variovorax sp. TaxID=114708 RepID=UPI0025DDCE92